MRKYILLGLVLISSIPLFGQVPLKDLERNGSVTGSIPYTINGRQYYRSISDVVFDTLQLDTIYSIIADSSLWSLNGSNHIYSKHERVGINVINPDVEFEVLGRSQIADALGNTFIGNGAGNGTLTGTQSFGLGANSLTSVTSGDNLQAIGVNSLRLLTTGVNTAAIGTNAGYDSNGSYNTFLNANAGYYSDGTGNFAAGRQAFDANTLGNYNVVNGYQALSANVSGSGNVVGGFRAMRSGGGSASYNVAQGYQALQSQTSNYSVAIGYRAGYTSTGASCVFLGPNAGYSELNSNRLYIENSTTSSPLIYGEFDNDILRINGTFQIGTALEFPTADGTVNQILGTDGSGNLDFLSLSSLDGLWTITGSDIYRNSNVMIGSTSAPTQELHVSGNIRVTGDYYDATNYQGDNGDYLLNTVSGPVWTAPTIGKMTTTSGQTGITTATKVDFGSVDFEQGTIDLNATDDDLEINEANKYKVTVIAEVRGVSGATEGEIYITNDAVQPNDEDGPNIKFDASGNWRTHSVTVYMDLALNDTIEVYIVKNSGTGSVEHNYITLQVEKI